MVLRRPGELKKFDPEKTSKEIVVLESAERWYRRAKDPENLFKAISEKVKRQREFVEWWDGQEKNKGGWRERNLAVPDLKRQDPKLEDYQLDRIIIFRWRHRFADPEKFEKYLEETKAKCLKVVECVQAANFSSETVEWYTPEQYLNSVRVVLGEIDLDPASNGEANRIVKAKRFFTKVDNGLVQDWHGRVFLNPPYGTVEGDSLASRFCDKAIAEHQAGRASEIVILVNSVHSQAWQRPLYDFLVCFVDHRIKFVSGDGEENENPTFQNIFVYIGPREVEFADEFSRYGYVMRKVDASIQ